MHRFVYITCASPEEARAIGAAVVEQRLAACANLIPGMESIYPWKGEMQHDRETVLILKSRADKVDALIAAVKELHSYEVPCIVTLPIQEGNPDYLRWLDENLD